MGPDNHSSPEKHQNDSKVTNVADNETLPHGWMGWHNTVFDCLAKAVPRAQGMIRINQRVPRVYANLSPEHVVISDEDKHIHIVDLAISCGNNYEAMAEVQRLSYKYTPIWLKTSSARVSMSRRTY